jgi:hypothetical protein
MLPEVTIRNKTRPVLPVEQIGVAAGALSDVSRGLSQYPKQSLG